MHQHLLGWRPVPTDNSALGASAIAVEPSMQHVFIGRGDTKAHAMRKRLWAMAEVLVPHKEVFDFNQALMDFGAMVCTARKPACQGCPMAKMCRSYPMDVAGAKRKRTR